MKKVFTLLISCFFFFRSYAWNDTGKASAGETPARARIAYRDVMPGAAYFADDFLAYVCEGYSRTFTVTAAGAKSFIWYKDDVPIPGETSNKLTVTKAGKYKAKPDNANMSNTVTVIIAQKPARPTLTFID